MNNSALVKGFIQLPIDKRKVFFNKLTSKNISLTQLPIPPIKSEFKRIPLSYAQERQWILWQLDPKSVAYNMPVALRLKGQFNIISLEKSFNHLIARHEVLRTHFIEDDSGVYQVIQPKAVLSIEQSNLEFIHNENKLEQYSRIKAYVYNEIQQPFDLFKGPLLKVKLLCISKNDHVLIMNQHHIVSDGWSMQLMVDELMKGYSAYAQGDDFFLPELPIQYTDYAIWQRCWMEAGEQKRQLDYWQEKLGNEQPILELPTDHARPKLQSFLGSSLDILLNTDLYKSLKKLAQQEGTTLFSLLLASFQVLLYRYSGQTDIRIGVPIANRNREETKNLIGFFVNTQVLQADVDGQIAFNEFLQQVKQTTIDAQHYQDLPFDQLVQALRPERDLGNSPLFQVMFNHQSEGVQEKNQLSTRLAELDINSVDCESNTAKFDLTLNTYEAENGISASFNYATDLFEAATIERLAKHWQQILQGMVAKPSQRISELTLLNQAEQKHILNDWNDTAVSYDNTSCIHELFEQQVNTNPDNTALVFEGESLSYQTLNQKANQLAHKLRELGVVPDTLVGIAVERSSEMVVGLLAILKAGGAYVPLDPDYPAARLAYMIEDSGIKLLLTQSYIEKQLALSGANPTKANSNIETVLLDNILSDDALTDYNNENIENVTNTNNLAYVIYTSGSTGKPKGVGNTHQALHNRLNWMQQEYRLTNEDSVLQKTPFSFDVSVWEFFWPLLTGARLVVASPDDHKDPERLVSLIKQEFITTLHFVPSMLQVFIQHETAGSCTSLQRVICSGEALSAELQTQALTTLPKANLYNLYGPTEAAIDVTHWTCVEEGLDSVPIGRPIDNMQTYIVDSELGVTPVGVIGELYLGGVGLARGYHQRPDLTAERFIANPFSEEGTRLYRTGDLARYRADGTIEYMGRIDHQVKIRGFRIELGEIEAQLQSHENIQDAVVLAQEGNTGQQLVAYVIPNDKVLIEADSDIQHDFRIQIKAHLQQALPEYMVPAHILLLDKLPLTPNGKLDRKALPKADASQLQQAYEAPTTELEKQLATIWQEVLDIEIVGLSDNFFELGGDSIVSIQLVSRARQAGLQFSPKDVFQYQTLSELARVTTNVADNVITAEQGLVVGESSLIPIHQVFFDEEPPQQHHWNQSVLLKLHQIMDSALLAKVLGKLVSHHDALRLNFTQKVNSDWQASFNDDVTISADMLWLRDVADESELTEVANEAQRSLSLGDGPLMRVVLFNLPQGEQRLLLVIHHLVVDGVSWRVLLEDLQTVYKQLQVNEKVTLPAKTSSIKAWSAQLSDYASSQTLSEEFDYWQKELSHVNAELPRDNSQGGQQKKHATSVTTQLDKNLTAQLLKQAPSAYRTQINDLLLTALSQVICDWTGEDSALIALEGHGREELFDDIDLTRTVGWFTSLFPVKLTPSKNLDSAIKTVKEQLRAIPNKGLGYGVLRYLSDNNMQQQMQALPQARITFNYLGQFDAGFDEEKGALFSPAQEDCGASQSEEAPLGNWLSIDGQVYGGELKLNWSFSSEVYRTATVQTLADNYTQALKALIEYCLVEGNQGLTPSDFPLIKLNQSQLDSLPVSITQIADIYPLSPMQQGMLFHSLHEQDEGAYLNQMRVDVSGIDVERFRQAWQSVLYRHEVLRAGFIWEGVDEPIQVIYQQADITLQVHDWRNRKDLLAKGQENLFKSELDAFSAELLKTGFTLSQAPLLRLDLVQLSESTYHLIYTNHHILMDGWSSSQLMGEVLQNYAGQTLPAVQGSYRDYLAWLQVQDKAQCEEFWMEQLTNLETPTLLAHAIKRSTEDVDTGSDWGEYKQTLNTYDTQHLIDFAKQQKVTVNTLLQAAWLLLLQRYTSQDTVVFGATVSGRPAEIVGIEQQLGLFINTLPVIATINPIETIGDYLRRIQNQNLSLREYEHTPLYDVQRWAGQAGGALFDSILVFENYPISEALQQGSPQGLVFGDVASHEQTNYGLTLAIGLGDSLSITTHYNRSHFSNEVVEQLIQQLTYLLQEFTEEAEQSVGNLSLLDNSYSKQWNPPSPDAPAKLSIQQRFEAQVLAQPQQTALVFEDEKLSYVELNSRVNRLAHKLIAKNVGPEVLVGIAVKRSVSMIVAVLAVLKTGAAYVPLDPSYPEDRLAYMAENSGLSLLLTQTDLADSIKFSAHVKRLFLDDHYLLSDSHLLDDSDANNTVNQETNPQYRAHPKNLAYLIYTSGTTGLPKGVGIDHGSFARHVEVYSERLGLTKEDCILQYATLNFDTFAEQLFPTLCCGATVVLRGEDIWDNNTFYNNLLHYGISVANLTPSMWYQLFKDFATQGLTDFGRLRRMIVGGEAMPLDGLALWQQLGLAKAELWNFYGPTEATAASTSFCCNRYFNNEEAIPTTIPIGQTLAGRYTYIVDNNLNLVPFGAVGELVIGGELLARGYYDRQALSAERFIADPFGKAGGRLYRTGDQARYQSDDTIEYLGRVDDQVKIRGFRIELGEIEAQLQSHESIQDAVVLAQEANTGQQLVAYVIPNDNMLIIADSDAQYAFRSEIKTHLQQALPEYMVPAHILLLEQLPLTPNGKLDRRALPKVDVSQLQQTYAAPTTELEQQLAIIWQEVLGLEQVGLNDNFFELGGHSLLILKMMGDITHKTAHTVSLHDLMFRPTIKQLADFLSQKNAEEADTPIVRLNTYQGEASPLFCIHPVAGNVYPYYSLALKLNEQRPVFGIMSRSYIDSDWLDQSWHEMVTEYVTYIRSQQAQGPYLLLGWSLGGLLAIEIAHVLEQQGEEVSFLGLLDTRRVSDIDIAAISKAQSSPNVIQPLALDVLHNKEVNIDLATIHSLRFIDNLFSSVDYDMLLSQYKHYQEKGLEQEDIRIAITTWVAEQENISSQEVDTMLDKYSFQQEMGIVGKVHDNLAQLSSAFDFKDLDASPDCWWASFSQTASEREHLEDVITSKTKGATSRLVDASHDDIVYNAELLQSIKDVLLGH